MVTLQWPWVELGQQENTIQLQKKKYLETL
jgi:hypothetical protein